MLMCPTLCGRGNLSLIKNAVTKKRMLHTTFNLCKSDPRKVFNKITQFGRSVARRI